MNAKIAAIKKGQDAQIVGELTLGRLQAKRALDAVLAAKQISPAVLKNAQAEYDQTVAWLDDTAAKKHELNTLTSAQTKLTKTAAKTATKTLTGARAPG